MSRSLCRGDSISIAATSLVHLGDLSISKWLFHLLLAAVVAVVVVATSRDSGLSARLGH